MTVSELITEIRALLTDTEEPYLWEDSELLSYLRDTLKFVKSYVFLDRAFNYPLTTISGTNNYTLDADIISVKLNDTNLAYVPYQLYLEIPTSSGTPTIYSVDNGILYLSPTPDNVYMLYVTLYYNDNISFNTNLTFPSIEVLKYGTIYRAYLKQDSETFNGVAASHFMSLYQNHLEMLKNRIIRDSNVLERSYIHEGLL